MLSYYTSLLAALDRGGELVRHLRVLADGLLLELEAHGDARRFVGRVERPREAGGLCCVTNLCVRLDAALFSQCIFEQNAGRWATYGEHAQGLGGGFYCVRIHRVFLSGEQQQALQQQDRRQQLKRL